MQRVPVTCPLKMFPTAFAGLHTVPATCVQCSVPTCPRNMSPSVYRPLDMDMKAFDIFHTLWLISNRRSAAVPPCEIEFLALKLTF